jgi:hypothetical protein
VCPELAHKAVPIFNDCLQLLDASTQAWPLAGLWRDALRDSAKALSQGQNMRSMARKNRDLDLAGLYRHPEKQSLEEDDEEENSLGSSFIGQTGSRQETSHVRTPLISPDISGWPPNRLPAAEPRPMEIEPSFLSNDTRIPSQTPSLSFLPQAVSRPNSQAGLFESDVPAFLSGYLPHGLSFAGLDSPL